MDEHLFKFKFNKLNVENLISNLYHYIGGMASIIYDSFSDDIKRSCLIYEIGVEKYDLMDICITYVFEVDKLMKIMTPEQLLIDIKNDFNCNVELRYLDEDKTECHIYVYVT